MLRKLSILILLLLAIACDEGPAQYSKLEAFDELHASIARYTAAIEARKVHWDSLGEVYRSRLSEDLTEEAYFELISELLLEFRDPHIQLVAPFKSMYAIENLGYIKNYDEAVVSAYLTQEESHSSKIKSAIVNDSIGYLFCADFKGEESLNHEIYKSVIEKFSDTKGLIIDLRVNDGGSVYNAQHLLNKFSEDRILWHTTQNRILGGFDEKFEWYIMPDTPFYPNKIIVLNGRFTISAGERFAMGAKLLDNMTILGDTTATTQGSVMGREMLNGWKYTLTFEKCLAPNGVSYEGLGIPPDEYIPAETTIVNGRDMVLERAIALLD